MRATAFVATVVVCLLIVPIACFGQAAATDDTYVVSSSGTANYGTSPSLAVLNPGVYSYIRLDLSRLPAGLTSAQVSKATLRLFVTAVTAPGSFDVCEVTGTWRESTLTYNTRPTLGACASGASLTSASKNQYVDLDITTFVKDWLNGTTNNGIELQPSSGSSISASFESKESTATSHDAELSVVFGTSLGQLSGQIGPSQVGPGTYNINISGSALTLAGPMGTCASGTFAIGITNSGNPNCAQPLFSQLGGLLTKPQLPSTVVYSDSSYPDPGWIPSLAGGKIIGNISGNAASITGSISGAQVSSAVANATHANNSDSATNATHATVADNATNASHATNADTAGFATSAGTAATANDASHATSADNANTATSASNLGGVPATSYARQDQGNSFNGTQALTQVGSGQNDSNALALRANDGSSNPVTAQLQMKQDGALSVKVEANGQPAAEVKVDAQGNVTAPKFTGDGSGLTGVTASSFSGNISESQVTNLSGDLNAITTNLSNEVTRAQGVEGTLTTNLGNEVTRSQAAEATLSNNLGNEVTRATGAEGMLTANLNGEASRAQAAENGIASNLTAEAAARIAGDAALTTGLNSETARAEAAEAGLTNQLGNKANLAGNNTFTAGKQTLAPADTGYASLNIPSAINAPQTAAAGDIWAAAGRLNYQKDNSVTQQLAFLDDVNGVVTGDKQYTDQQVAAETSRAQTAETGLSTSITTETSRAQAAESALTGSLNGEVSRAQATETTLTANLGNEVSRATGVEATKAGLTGDNTFSGTQVLLPTAPSGAADSNLLQLQANNGSTTTTAQLQMKQGGSFSLQIAANGQPAAEKMSIGSDGTVSAPKFSGDGSGLTNVTASGFSGSISESQVTNLTGDLNTITTNLGDEVTRARGAEDTLTSSLANEVTRATGAEGTLTANLNGEVTRAQAAEATLTTNLNSEVSRAQGAEATLTTNLSNEVSRATAAETAESSRAQGAEATLSTGIASESTRAQGAEAALNTAVGAETTRATAAETTLTTSVNNKADLNRPVLSVPSLPNLPCGLDVMVLLQGAPVGQQLYVCRNDSGNPTWALVNDDSATVSGDRQYTDQQVAIEKARAEGAEGTLTTNLGNEVNRAQAAEATLTTNLNSEVSRATAAEGALNTSISAEASRAQGAEAALNNAIGAETTRATAAETTLTSSLANEVSRATASEATLGGAIATESTRAQAAEATKESTANKDQGGGYAGLDSNKLIATTEIPSLSGTYVDLTSAQSVGGAKTYTAPAAWAPAGAGPSKPSNVLQLNATDAGDNAVSAQLQASETGGLNLQFGPIGSATTKLSINADGTINFGAGQQFPGISGDFVDLSSNQTIAGSKTFSNTINGSISGNAATATTAMTAGTISGSITESQVTGLTGDLATKATAALITGATNTKITYNAQGIVTVGAQAQFSDIGGTAASSQLPSATSSAQGAVMPTILSATTNNVNVAKNTSQTFTVACATGRFVLGGGVNIGTNPSANLTVSATYPSDVRTWTAVVNNNTNGNVIGATVTVYVICSGN